MNALLPTTAFAALTFWAFQAHATASFPGVVASQLALPAVTIDPPAGCKLCHVSEAGGDPLSLFGGIMHSLGATKYDEPSVRAALAQVQTNYPQLIADIEQGVDPNSDTSISSRPSPEYGCSASAAKAGGGGVPFVTATLIFYFAIRRRLRGAVAT